MNDREFVTRSDDDSGVTIGLQASIWESVSSGKFQQIREDRARVNERVVQLDEKSTIYPDGLLIKLDTRWSSDFMSLEPEARDG